jgi:hypothetical protein
MNRQSEALLCAVTPAGAVPKEERVLMKIRDSTMRTLLLVEIVSFAVLLVLGLIQFDPPLSLVTVGGFAVAIGACFITLRKTPRKPSGQF